MPSRFFSLRLSAFNAFLFLSSGIQLPFLPLWLKEKGLDAGQIGIILAAMVAVRVLASPMGAYTADRFGNRRRVISITTTASFGCFLLMGVVPGFPLILLLGTLAAAFFAPVGPLAEVLAIEGSTLHGLDYGRIRLWASVSFLAGSLLSGALLVIVPTASVIFLIAGAQGLGALATLVLPADPVKKSQTQAPVQIGAIAWFLVTGPFLIFLAAAGIGQASHGFFYGFGSVHWQQIGYSTFTIGELWATAVLVEVAMFAVSNRIFTAFGSVRLIAFGISCGLVRWILTGLEPPLWLLFVVQTLHAGSFGILHLGTMHYIRETVPAGMRNTVQGIYAALSGGILLSSSMWAAGTLYGSFGGATYFAMAGCSAIALGLAIMLVQVSPRDPAAAAP